MIKTMTNKTFTMLSIGKKPSIYSKADKRANNIKYFKLQFYNLNRNPQNTIKAQFSLLIIILMVMRTTLLDSPSL